jgi:PII-like signaling protein
MKALSAAGTMHTAKVHVLAQYLPGVFEVDDATGNVVVTLIEVTSLTFGGLLFDADVARAGTHMAVTTGRWARIR